MTYMTVRECEAQGGACPRVCLDMTSTEVQCATTCYDGCYCAPGFYLLNSSCVPLAQCPCYHQGEMYPAGATLPVDACNNWYLSLLVHRIKEEDQTVALTFHKYSNLCVKSLVLTLCVKQHMHRWRNAVWDSSLPR